MTYPIVKRLSRETLYTSGGEQSDLPEEAADLIEALAAALEPFEKAAYEVDKRVADHARLGMGTVSDNASTGLGIKFGDIRRAREVLRKLRGETP